MERKKLIEGYFSFSRKDRIGILLLTGLIILVFFLPAFFHADVARINPAPDTAWIAALRQLEADQPAGKSGYARRLPDDDGFNSYPYGRNETKTTDNPGKLFDFDPNTLSITGWKELGIREKTIHTILNYIHKGGHFNEPEDLRRIYGLHEDQYQRLQPYIKIAATQPHSTFNNEEHARNTNKAFRYTSIDINTADTTAFIALPGMGSKLAMRIISFREKLGGFYSIGQLAEIYGLADSTFQRIRPLLKLEDQPVRKININTATVDELKSHPYIRYMLAGPIVSYRKEHGLFSTIEDIKKIMVVTREVYDRIAPYLSVD